MDQSDETLCARVASRDDAAFDLLVERYQARAYRLAWSIVRDADDARDISQEAFLRLYQNAHRFQERARFATWFYRILVNLALDHRRRHRWWHRVLGDSGGSDSTGGTPVIEREAAPGPAPDDDAVRKDTMTRLWREVDRLSPQQRAAVVLQLEGLPTGEIAGVLGCSEPTVRVHLHRALTALRKSMGKG
ncbi:MAG: RNA polymerase sigma factor [Candidatus Rokubacteria bacterium]|nr:RNA polymerase sigma factor [Candidatus Rokubacteria bacterium]